MGSNDVPNAPPDLPQTVGERRYRQLLDHGPYPMCVHADGHVVYVNSAAVSAVGGESAEHLVGRRITEFVHPESIAPMLNRIGDLRQEGDSSEPAEAVMLRLDGSAVAAEIVSVLTSWDGRPAYQVIFHDLRAITPDERRWHTVVNSLHEGVVVLDAQGSVDWMNPAARHILGVPMEGTSFHRMSTFTVGGESLVGGRRFLARMMAADAGSRRDVVVGYVLPDGSKRWLSFNVRVLDQCTGRPSVLLSFTDVTDQHDARLRLDHQAHHDSLTGLPNRAYVEAKVLEALRRDPTELTAVMFLDLDNLKTVNDTHGHQAGDVVITAAARRLRATLRAGDFVARHGGDEFVALLFGRADHTPIDELSTRLHRALARPLGVDGAAPHVITASIGVTEVRPREPRSAAQILHDADAAMYEAKTQRAVTRYATTIHPA